ncbi:hypothetical protein FA13DRAFT_1775966 [Coprinellus micaceus]|uniref:Uncharacterized protein n=1 Tax=Coprinellus micaceus TaxID=71717 RepID=A0A4Y7T290_COPMI|nr:hypothetical protein FA13DRAFT_1775966 [Coprinellus micaceus]
MATLAKLILSLFIFISLWGARANLYSEDIDQRSGVEVASPYSRGITHEGLDGTLDSRSSDFGILDARSTTPNYNEVLYARELIDAILTSHLPPREVGRDVEGGLERRAREAWIVPKSLHGYKHDRFAVWIGASTWHNVKMQIYEDWNAQIAWQDIHVRWHKVEQQDGGLLPDEITEGTLVWYYLDNYPDPIPGGACVLPPTDGWRAPRLRRREANPPEGKKPCRRIVYEGKAKPVKKIPAAQKKAKQGKKLPLAKRVGKAVQKTAVAKGKGKSSRK